jgi:predicted ester cyclase
VPSPLSILRSPKGLTPRSPAHVSIIVLIGISTMKSLTTRIKAANQKLIANGEHEAIEEFFSPDYVAHLTGHNVGGGHKLVRSLLELYQRAFPQPKVEVEILLEGPDRIAWQRTLRAKHVGAFKGFPASGREIVWRDVVTSRFHDGLIVEEWVISDLAEQLLLSRKQA